MFWCGSTKHKIRNFPVAKGKGERGGKGDKGGRGGGHGRGHGKGSKGGREKGAKGKGGKPKPTATFNKASLSQKKKKKT